MCGFENGCGVLSFFQLLCFYFHLLNNDEAMILEGLSHEIGTDVSFGLLDTGLISLS